MDLKQLKYFITIADEEQITSAAKRLHIAQPPLSQQLKNLETELDVQLFYRTSRRLQLTEAGKLFLNRARQIVDLASSAKQEITDYAHGYEGTLLLGITPTSVPMILSGKMTDFHKDYPGINFEFFEGTTYEVINKLKKGMIDIGIVRSPFNVSEFNYCEKNPEPMVAVMHEEQNWSSSPACSLPELQKRDLIIYRRYEQLLYDAFQISNITPHITCKCDRSSTALRCAAAGLGVALLPASALLLTNKNLICKTIQSDFLMTKAAVIWPPNHHLTKPAATFLEYFKSL